MKCILYDRKCAKAEWFVNPVSKDVKPLITDNIDHIGPLVTTYKQYRQIFTVVDDITKYEKYPHFWHTQRP